MNNIKIVTIIGARPQFIKSAPISKTIISHYNNKIQELVVHTGQHYDYKMSDVFFDELGLSNPAYHLGIGSGLHGLQTGRMLLEIEKVLIKEKPEVVMIYGDTNSTMAAALAASKLHIPIAHIEAGLRSYNRKMPEEINRIVSDVISTFLFCPTNTALANLKQEGIIKGVMKTGDVMYDSLLLYLSLAETSSNILSELELDRYALATIHRAENTDDPKRLQSIMNALLKVNEGNPVVIPMHPRTKKALESISTDLSTLKIIPPVSYLDMLLLEKNARIILTDSGGVQKEAYMFKVPCVTLRDETEWVEIVENGWNIIAGSEENMIVNCVEKMLAINVGEKEHDAELFGDGFASKKIIDVIYKRYSNN